MKVTHERRSRFPLFAAALLLGAADPADPLTLPLSPGSVALLVERSAEQLRAGAFSSSQPGSRPAISRLPCSFSLSKRAF
jgi:hypothetical protein